MIILASLTEELSFTSVSLSSLFCFPALSYQLFKQLFSCSVLLDLHVKLIYVVSIVFHIIHSLYLLIVDESQ